MKNDSISRQDALDVLDEFQESVENGTPCYAKARAQMCNLQSIQPEREISYRDCCYAMLKMWINDVITDGEYNKIMDKLNEHENLKWLNDEYAVNQWNPCSERLPEESGTYTVYGRWSSGKVGVGECEFSIDDGYFRTAWNFDVLAWMPLPEPYKGGEQDAPDRR